MGFGLPGPASPDAARTRAPHLLLCAIAGLLALGVMVQCAVAAVIEFVMVPPHDGAALGFVLVGLAPVGAAFGSWRLGVGVGVGESAPRIRTFRAAVVTLIVEAVVIAWLAGEGLQVVNAQWAHWL